MTSCNSGETKVEIDGKYYCAVDPQCPSSTPNFDPSQDKCYFVPDCPEPYPNEDWNQDVCWGNVIKNCPAGSTVEHTTEYNICVANATCPPEYKGGLDTTTDVCWTNATCPCPSLNPVFNGTIDKCVLPHRCPDSGSIDNARAVCYKNVECPSGGTLLRDADVCSKGPVKCPDCPDCNRGDTPYYDKRLQKCTVKPLCPGESKYDPEHDICVKSVKCPVTETLASGIYNAEIDKCTMNPSYKCPRCKMSCPFENYPNLNEEKGVCTGN
jgi:hypothetical protein